MLSVYILERKLISIKHFKIVSPATFVNKSYQLKINLTSYTIVHFSTLSGNIRFICTLYETMASHFLAVLNFPDCWVFIKYVHAHILCNCNFF